MTTLKSQNERLVEILRKRQENYKHLVRRTDGQLPPEIQEAKKMEWAEIKKHGGVVAGSRKPNTPDIVCPNGDRCPWRTKNCLR
jgi:hypothetical protein